MSIQLARPLTTPGQAGTSGAANRARKNQEVQDLREQVAQLRDQNATLTFSLGCSERRVAGLVSLTSQLYISYGDSSTGKSLAELSLAAKSAEVVRLTDDLAALAQAHEALKAHIATSETSAAQRIAAKDREIADLQAKARVLPDKQLLKKKDEEIAAMELALNSLHSFKSSLLMQLRMRDEDIRALKADLAAARAVSEAAAARADSEVTAARALGPRRRLRWPGRRQRSPRLRRHPKLRQVRLQLSWQPEQPPGAKRLSVSSASVLHTIPTSTLSTRASATPVTT